MSHGPKTIDLTDCTVCQEDVSSFASSVLCIDCGKVTCTECTLTWHYRQMFLLGDAPACPHCKEIQILDIHMTLTETNTWGDYAPKEMEAETETEEDLEYD